MHTTHHRIAPQSSHPFKTHRLGDQRYRAALTVFHPRNNSNTRLHAPRTRRIFYVLGFEGSEPLLKRAGGEFPHLVTLPDDLRVGWREQLPPFPVGHNRELWQFGVAYIDHTGP